MKILAIETSGKTLSLALAHDGVLVGEVFYQAGHTHSERLLPEMDTLLASAGWHLRDLEKIAVSVGPGSFTGIRIGLVCARVLAQELQLPLVGVDTLTIMEAAVSAHGCTVIPCIDAMRNEVYVRGKKTIEIQPADAFFKGLAKKKSKVVIVGNGTVAFADILKKYHLSSAGPAFSNPRAGTLALMSESIKGVHHEKVLPLYIRKSWAEESKKQLKK